MTAPVESVIITVDGQIQGGGGTAATVPSYENPTIPQFSRWAPEIYLPLNGSIADAGPLGRTTALFGPVSADFVADSPFGTGESLRVNPDAIGARNSGLQIEAATNAEMSFVANSAFPPWALGFWFKAAALPSISFGVFQTLNPWAAYGKGTQIINTTGRLQIYQFGSPNYEPTTTSLCDGNWHHIMIRYPKYSVGKIGELNGRVWIDGVAVGNAGTAPMFNQPPATPTVKVLGCDTAQPYQISDFWYTNSIPPDDLANLLWNGGAGKRYTEAGLIT